MSGARWAIEKGFGPGRSGLFLAKECVGLIVAPNLRCQEKHLAEKPGRNLPLGRGQLSSTQCGQKGTGSSASSSTLKGAYHLPQDEAACWVYGGGRGADSSSILSFWLAQESQAATGQRYLTYRTLWKNDSSAASGPMSDKASTPAGAVWTLLQQGALLVLDEPLGNTGPGSGGGNCCGAYGWWKRPGNSAFPCTT